MDFQPTADQLALTAAVREFCQDRFPASRLKGLAANGGFDRALWSGLDEMGVFSLGLAEADGGAGLGNAEAALVFEELGRALVPGPLTSSYLAAGLPGAAGEPGPAPGAIVAAVETGDAPVLVEHLPSITGLVIVDDRGLYWVPAGEVAALAVAVSQPVDPLTPLARLERLPEGRQLGGPAEVLAWRRRGAVLTAALQVGIADAVTGLAVAYAKQREQFGRPVAGFQAVKHICADMLVRTELARAATHAAAVTLDDPTVGDLNRSIATAKLLADEAATANARAAVQVHGGMGFTWEIDVHFYLKRAWVLATAFGTEEDHAEALAQLL